MAEQLYKTPDESHDTVQQRRRRRFLVAIISYLEILSLDCFNPASSRCCAHSSPYGPIRHFRLDLQLSASATKRRFACDKLLYSTKSYTLPLGFLVLLPHEVVIRAIPITTPIYCTLELSYSQYCEIRRQNTIRNDLYTNNSASYALLINL